MLRRRNDLIWGRVGQREHTLISSEIVADIKLVAVGIKRLLDPPAAFGIRKIDRLSVYFLPLGVRNNLHLRNIPLLGVDIVFHNNAQLLGVQEQKCPNRIDADTVYKQLDQKKTKVKGWKNLEYTKKVIKKAEKVYEQERQKEKESDLS